MAVDNRTENRNYPLPDKDNKLNEDVLRLIAALQAIDVDIADIIAALATKAAASHPHVISDITGLQDALNGKAASNHQHALNDLTDVDVSSAANNQVLKRVGSLWVPATLQIGDVNGLQAILDEFGAIGAVVVLKGTWDASTGVFPGGGQAKAGWSFIVSNSGVVDGVDFEAGDRIIAITDSASQTTYAGNWHKADYTDQVLSVAGKTGAVTLDTSDISGLAGALDGKVSTSRQVLTSGLATGGGDLTANRTIDVPIASQAEAEAGAINDKAMTPLRTKQAIAAQVTSGIADVRLGSESSTLGGADVTIRVPSGSLLVGFRTDSDWDIREVFSRPLQKRVSGSWVTVSQA